MAAKTKKFIILGLILICLPLAFILLGKIQHNFTNVPYFIPEQVNQKMVDGVLVSDTIWATIPPFEFTNQDGKTVTNADYEGHIYVADFFFTTCQTICPKMTGQMNQLMWQLEGKAGKDIKYISFTVDPEHDTTEVLKEYAEKHKVDTSKWNLVTGEKEKIYQLGVEGFKLSTQEDLQAAGGFLHSEKFVLVDEEGHIRGYFDGTSSVQMRLLAGDIKKLVSEKKHKSLAKKE